MNIYLGKHFEAMIREKVASGRYANASEVVREALRRMEDEDEGRLGRLRALVDEGIAAGERGELHEASDDFYACVSEEATERARQGARIESSDAVWS
jgi:antitoxin ParD1/3/4